jgi:hypothetical protein
MMNCGVCGIELTARRGGFLGLQKQPPPFCPGCGEATQPSCETCGKKLIVGVAFCEYCGTPASRGKITPPGAVRGAAAAGAGVLASQPDAPKIARPVRSEAAWTARNQEEFRSWCRRQTELARVCGVMVGQVAQSKLVYPSWSSEVNAAADRLVGDDAARLRGSVLLLADADLTPLGRDSDPSAFSTASGSLVAAINQDLDKFAARVPAAEPLLRDLRLGPTHAARVADEMAATCRREIARYLQELMQYHAQVRAGRALFADTGNSELSSFLRNFGLGAMAAINPVVGLPMLAASIFSTHKQGEHKTTQSQSVLQAFKAATDCMTALDEAYPRAIQAIGDEAGRKVAHVARVLGEGLLRSEIAPTVAWNLINKAELKELRTSASDLYQNAPSLREAIRALPLSPETAEALR